LLLRAAEPRTACRFVPMRRHSVADRREGLSKKKASKRDRVGRAPPRGWSQRVTCPAPWPARPRADADGASVYRRGGRKGQL